MHNAQLKSSQIPLPWVVDPDYAETSFMDASFNRMGHNLVRAWPDWPAPIAILQGPPGTGKTHLAHIWRSYSNAQWLEATQVTMWQEKSGHGIIIDDCDRMLEETQTDEERHTRLEYGLFRVLNAAIQNTTPLLLCTRCAPAQWPVRLRDLHSRLQLAVPVVMMRPDDAFLHAFLHRQCELRGLYIPENVLVYMLSRLERSCASVLEALQLLDYHTASRKRRLTIPLVCEILFGKNSAP